ncbi:hypothetical protein ACQP2Y_46675 (plasmid) [Actinoplanes sp. CA-051413]|uniref:hypothetical protein n=1 Tax=Actinoplanes sp. CA-051413 TaxID=3239899 RepID=UPI003D957523
MSPTAAFIAFFIGATLIAGITGLLTARFNATPIIILGMTAGAFVGTLTLAMTSYAFLT